MSSEPVGNIINSVAFKQASMVRERFAPHLFCRLRIPVVSYIRSEILRKIAKDI